MLPTREHVRERMRRIFPTEIVHRPSLLQPVAADVVWVALYVGAIDRRRYLRPSMVYWMRDSIAADQSDETRNRYFDAALGNARRVEEVFAASRGQRWYADNTREVMRDDILRYGLYAVGAVERNESAPTNSPKPVWCLEQEFADLFRPSLVDGLLAESILRWQATHFDSALQARLRAKQQTHTASHEVVVHCPDGSERRLEAGASSLIAKAVVEELAPRVMARPKVLSISESRQHVADVDAAALKEVGLTHDAHRLLPDIVMLDEATNELWCVELVATDGPFNDLRVKDVLGWTRSAGFHAESVQLVTAFRSRTHGTFRTLAPNLAPGTSVFFSDEPQLLLSLTRLD